MVKSGLIFGGTILLRQSKNWGSLTARSQFGIASDWFGEAIRRPYRVTRGFPACGSSCWNTSATIGCILCSNKAIRSM